MICRKENRDRKDRDIIYIWLAYIFGIMS